MCPGPSPVSCSPVRLSSISHPLVLFNSAPSPTLLSSCSTYCAADNAQSILEVVPHLLQHTGIQISQPRRQGEVDQTVQALAGHGNRTEVTSNTLLQQLLCGIREQRRHWLEGASKGHLVLPPGSQQGRPQPAQVAQSPIIPHLECP